MKNWIYFLLLVFSISMVACEKDNYGAPPFDPNKPVSFSKEVLPLFTTNCAKSSCHVPGAIAPDLTPANAYDQLTGLGYVPTDGINAEKCKLYVIMMNASKPMPPAGKLPASQTNLILGWIIQGAQNN